MDDPNASPKPTPFSAADPEIPARVVGAERQANRDPFMLPEGAPLDESQQSPEVGFWTRLMLKNLSANPQNAVNWLRQKGLEAYTYQPTGADMMGVSAGSDSGQKMRIAVKKPTDTEFKVVDPANFDAQDLTDLLGDLVFGGLTQAAASYGAKVGAGLGASGGTAVGGPMGGVAGGIAGFLGGGAAAGGVASAGVEAGRQELGNAATSMFGQPPLNPTLDTDAMKSQAMGGAIAAPVGKAVGALGKGAAAGARAVGRGVERVALGMESYLAHVSPAQMAEALLNKTIALAPDLSGKLSSDVAQRTMQFLTGLDESKTVEYANAQALLKANGSGQVELTPILQAIRDEITSPFRDATGPPVRNPATGRMMPGPPVKVAQQAGKFGFASDANDRTRQILVTEAGNLARNAGFDSVEDALRGGAKIPVDAAEGLKRGYAQEADYAAKSLEKDSAKEAAHGFLADQLREGVRGSMPAGPQRDAYVDLMAKAGKKLGLAKELQDALIAGGAEEVEPAAGGTPEVIQAANRPEQFFRTFLNRGARSGQTGLVREFGRRWAPELSAPGVGLGADAQFPDGFAGRARFASMADAFRANEAGTFTGGPPQIVTAAPALSFGGKPLGASLGAAVGGLVGYMIGGPEGALTGAGAGAIPGAYAASPRGSIQTASAIQKIARGATSMFAAPAEMMGSRTGAATAGMTASRETGSMQEAKGRAATTAQATRNVDAETMLALTNIASDVRKMMASNPNFTQQDAAAEFGKRAKEFLEERRLVLASP